MGEFSRLRVAYETMKSKLRTMVIMSLVFMGLAAMYPAFYPSFKGSIEEMMKNMPEMGFIRGFESMASYPGFLNAELYQIFWVLIGGILVGYISASLLSEEVESKTIDLLLSNPISRTRVVVEKFLGVIPLIIIVNFATMGSVYGMTIVMNQSLSFTHLFLTHLVSIPYFLAIASIGVLVSTIIDKKMKASILVMGLIVGMYIFESISLLVPDYEAIGFISLIHYFDPADILIHGHVSLGGVSLLILVTVGCLTAAVTHFDRRDIAI